MPTAEGRGSRVNSSRSLSISAKAAFILKNYIYKCITHNLLRKSNLKILPWLRRFVHRLINRDTIMVIKKFQIFAKLSYRDRNVSILPSFERRKGCVFGGNCTT